MYRYGRDFGQYDRGYRLSPPGWGWNGDYDPRYDRRAEGDGGHRRWSRTLPPDEWSWGFGPYERRTGWGAERFRHGWKSHERTDYGDPFGDRVRHTPIRVRYPAPTYDRRVRARGYDAEYPEWWSRRTGLFGHRHDEFSYGGGYWF